MTTRFRLMYLTDISNAMFGRQQRLFVGFTMPLNERTDDGKPCSECFRVGFPVSTTLPDER